MAIHIDQENLIAISNSNQHEAITGLQQLGFHRESTHLWIGTNHSSDDTLTHMDPQELERYLHATSQTPCTHLDNETQEVSDASFRCGGSSGKKVDRTEGVHLTYEDPHHEATEAILWTSVAISILLVILLPLAIFL